MELLSEGRVSLCVLATSICQAMQRKQPDMFCNGRCMLLVSVISVTWAERLFSIINSERETMSHNNGTKWKQERQCIASLIF